MTINTRDLEDAFDNADWDPQYYSAGEKFHTVSAFKILVEERTIYLELTGTSYDGSIYNVRVCEFDEDDEEIVGTSDLEDCETVEEILNIIQQYLEEN